MIQQVKIRTVLLSSVVAVSAFIIDLTLPLGVAGGVLYVALMLTGTWLPKRRHIVYLALISTALTFTGFFMSPPGGMMWIEATNRGLAIFAICITASLIFYLKTIKMTLQENNDRFRFFSELTSEGIIISDKGQYLDCNEAAKSTFGYSHNEFLALTPKDLIKGSDLASVMDHMINDIEDEYEVTAIKKDGTLFPAEIKARLFERNQKVLRVTFFRDITERIKSQESLHLALAKADEANKAKSDFLASMSHELRTPLNAVLGFAQMLQFDPKNPLKKEQNDYVESILEGGAHLLELVNDVLDLARIEADKLDLSIDEVHATAVIENCVKFSKPLGLDRSIKIINKFDETLPTIRTDEMRLKQILINLISNAVKFNKNMGTVTISGNQTDKNFLRISVTDTGIGIAKKDHAKVFHKFSRLNADPMIYKEGAGIGLTVTQLLVERMAGKIGFDSGEGIGSTFWIELPFASNQNALIWTKAMRTDIDAIDNDHQALILLLNKASVTEANDPAITGIIDDLIDYTVYHFKREERVMEVCNYPDITNHRKRHANLLTKVNRLAQNWTEHQDEEKLELLRCFLRTWLFDHIIKEDVQIAPYARGKSEEIRHTLNKFHP